MKITDEMVTAGMVAWQQAAIDAPDEAVPQRRRRCIRAALEAALAAAPAVAAEPVAWTSDTDLALIKLYEERVKTLNIASVQTPKYDVPLYTGPKETP